MRIFLLAIFLCAMSAQAQTPRPFLLFDVTGNAFPNGTGSAYTGATPPPFTCYTNVSGTVQACNFSGGGVGTRSLSCQPGLGDGLNALTAGTYLQTTCRNETGATWTITAIRCVTDSGSSTCNVTNGAGTALLSTAVTGTSTYVNGTQSGTTTIASGDFLKITFVADGTTKQIGIDVAGTY